jgi:hypothetical protein
LRQLDNTALSTTGELKPLLMWNGTVRGEVCPDKIMQSEELVFAMLQQEQMLIKLKKKKEPGFMTLKFNEAEVWNLTDKRKDFMHPG